MTIKNKNFLWFLYMVYTIFNILVIDIKVFGLNLRYLIFIALIMTVFLFENTFNKRNLHFLLKIYYISVVLISYSFIVKSNKISNILWFIIPYSTLLLIPVFNALYTEFSPKKVIKFFVIAIYILSLYYISLLICFIYFPNIAIKIFDIHGLATLTITETGFPRIFLKTSVFFIPALVYQLVYQKSAITKLLICFFTIIQIFLFNAFGLFFGVIAVFILSLWYKGKRVFTFFLMIIFSLSSTFIFYNRESVFEKSKLYSIDTKISQLKLGFEVKDVGSLLLGEGIGAPIKSLDERNLNDDFVIEVAPVMLYVVGGLLMSLLILYVYLWYAVKGFYRSLSFNNDDLAFLSISQIGMIFASFSNPYIWSGGVGILMVSMLVPLVHNFYRLKNN
jgi:hypothetical protein